MNQIIKSLQNFSPYIRSFIIGSSWPVFIFYFIPVSKFGDKMNLDYTIYTFIAPPFLGLLNAFGLLLKRTYNLTNGERFLYTGFLGALIIGTTITLTQIYNYDSQCRWIKQYMILLLFYAFIFNVIIYILDSVV